MATGIKIKADDVAAVFRKEIQDAVKRLKAVRAWNRELRVVLPLV